MPVKILPYHYLQVHHILQKYTPVSYAEEEVMEPAEIKYKKLVLIYTYFLFGNLAGVADDLIYYFDSRTHHHHSNPVSDILRTEKAYGRESRTFVDVGFQSRVNNH